jgi:glyoxylase-like metal-dependent hydrolase (beta-lactamase superfamily II)
MLEKDAAPGIHRVEDGYVNFFLVEDGDALTVVDTGHPRSWGALMDALRDVGRPASAIEAVVLTHAHFDHMGFAERARRQLGVTVWAHEDEVPVTRHPWRYDHERSRLPYLRHPGFVRMFTAMAARGALWVRGAERVATFGSTGALDVPGRPELVFTPGHTYGHTALLFPSRGALVAGDALVTLDPYTGRGGPQIVSGAATADSARALGSLDALAGLDAATVLTGHGPVWTGGIGPAVERARAAGPS